MITREHQVQDNEVAYRNKRGKPIAFTYTWVIDDNMYVGHLGRARFVLIKDTLAVEIVL